LSKHALKADVKPGGIHLNHIIELQQLILASDWRAVHLVLTWQERMPWSRWRQPKEVVL